MGTVTEAINQDLDELTTKAITSLKRASEDLVSWVDLVRDPEKPWALGWSKKSVRGANVAATNYILQTAAFCGVLDQVLTPQMRRQGAAWIRSLEVEENVFADPALLERKPPAWDDGQENWPPDGAHKEAPAAVCVSTKMLLWISSPVPRRHPGRRRATPMCWTGSSRWNPTGAGSAGSSTA